MLKKKENTAFAQNEFYCRVRQLVNSIKISIFNFNGKGGRKVVKIMDVVMNSYLLRHPIVEQSSLLSLQ